MATTLHTATRGNPFFVKQVVGLLTNEPGDETDESQMGAVPVGSHALAEWQVLGVRTIDGNDLPSVDIGGSVILPSAASEPAFLVYENYRTIMRWNRSHLFAISVGHLADRISGKPPLQSNRVSSSD